MSELRIREVGYDHPDAALLIAEVQAEYVLRYGGPDDSPVDPAQFSAANGLFAVGYQDRRPVVMGGWRLRDPDDPHTGWAAPAAEIKRMYVVAAARGAGFARQMLAFLERTAGTRGARWLLLETGSKQPEAIALYRSAGYQDVPPFGHYAEAPLAVHLGKQVG
ncbi:MAG TPA: GNAT family N-acetyltransferase [Jatrophihabitans sp.]|nr:GNAT family N-acetyltransferase [Jatrophihabitans sp.]